MPEELHQKISQFLDNELEVNEALHLLTALQQREELHHKMQRYQAISHALKTQVFLPIKTDFSHRIAQAVHEHEEPLKQYFEEHNPVKWTRWRAVAISVACTAIITANLIAFAKPAKTISALPITKTALNAYALNKQTNYTLVLHSNDVDNLNKTKVKTVAYRQK